MLKRTDKWKKDKFSEKVNELWKKEGLKQRNIRDRSISGRYSFQLPPSDEHLVKTVQSPAKSHGIGAETLFVDITVQSRCPVPANQDIDHHKNVLLAPLLVDQYPPVSTKTTIRTCWYFHGLQLVVQYSPTST
ncbi:hypothetical protein RRG08_040869 [Elysia crispata]|uniref:Uncharacterized protein n=1 Tax=Elysia crispata TaxID=231223 RepID=A0AAE1B058_9GAST|nr:hypothetical protein RRG08_040869 [Elysia crispata]